ncbi:nodulation protein NfeD [Spiribacter sp. C176]|uniref:Nodulation protein NfeD n=1 Tax=Spiribacter salilacus TaxID=2664894 RepID=A0A6N7QQ54_9GAMM|nr:nodulation protein NfeD [Spiribacter salilacus]MRH77513.1 nodulation protein NfeD [Spiribacter salilacus]
MRYSLWAAFLFVFFSASASADDVHRLVINGAIGPATAEYVVDGIETAAVDGASAVILQMDTPGGLDSAMRDIIQAILASQVPILGYVGPSGARAASAGTYILYGSHLAAMAPGTNLGAATPVQIGAAEESESELSASERKMINDAVAYIRSLAELRGRNAEWAERAVRESVSLSADAALNENVIDAVVADTTELLSRFDGVSVELDSGEQTLNLSEARITDRLPDWRQRLLAAVTNPNVAYILMLVGIYGLIFELANPGSLVPGTIGAISLLLALYALQALPINLAGLGLLALGVLLMIGEALVPSFGAMGVGGVIAFALGSLMLFDTAGPGFELSMWLVAGVTASSLVVFMGTAMLALRAFRRRSVGGTDHMLNTEGEVIAVTPKLRVRVEGENWLAECTEPLAVGDRVIIRNWHDLILQVEKLDD